MGRCVAEACNCLNGSERICCKYWNNEHETNDAALQSVGRWNKVAITIREKCMAHLTMSLADRQEIRDIWKDQVKRRMQIGSDDIRFHFSAGMAIRNILRQVVPDHKLPPVSQPDGALAQNWDDYYYGALNEYVRNHA